MKKRKYDVILTRDFLQREHVEGLKAAAKIAAEVGCDPATVVSYLHYYQIPYRTHLYPNRKMETHSGWKGYGEISRTQYNNIRANAAKRSIDFCVTIEDLWAVYLAQDRKCALSGRDIGFVHAKRGNASLDRKNSDEPYTLENIWWVHADVNFAKQSLTVDQFLSLCHDVVITHEKKVPHEA